MLRESSALVEPRLGSVPVWKWFFVLQLSFRVSPIPVDPEYEWWVSCSLCCTLFVFHSATCGFCLSWFLFLLLCQLFFSSLNFFFFFLGGGSVSLHIINLSIQWSSCRCFSHSASSSVWEREWCSLLQFCFMQKIVCVCVCVCMWVCVCACMCVCMHVCVLWGLDIDQLWKLKLGMLCITMLQTHACRNWQPQTSVSSPPPPTPTFFFLDTNLFKCLL